MAALSRQTLLDKARSTAMPAQIHIHIIVEETK